MTLADGPAVDWLDDLAAAVEVVAPGAGWGALLAELTDQQRHDVVRVLAGIRRERSLEDSTPR